jgi:hypothetical protein
MPFSQALEAHGADREVVARRGLKKREADDHIFKTAQSLIIETIPGYFIRIL